jgi:hypothetical protein
MSTNYILFLYPSAYVNNYTCEFCCLSKMLTVSLIAGAVVVQKEGRDIVVEFSASVRGCYCEPGYIHLRKLSRGNNEFVDVCDGKSNKP